MSTYTLKTNRTTVHIDGIDEATKASADGMTYAQSACPVITRSVHLSPRAVGDDIVTALAEARADRRNLCKHCEKAAERVIAANAAAETTTDTDTTTDTPEETPVTTTTVHTADTVTLPDGITETPALRPVYAAILNAGSGTAKDIESNTGIILAKVRVALNILKSLGLVTSTDQAKPGQSVVWSVAGTDATDLFADTLSLDLGTVRTGDDTVTVDAGWNTMNDDMPLDDEDDAPADDDTDTDTDDAPAQDATDGDADDEDGDDTPAPVVDTPPATRRAPKRVRLLAIYPGETVRAERTGPFKTVRPNENPLTRGGLIAEVTEWFASHPDEDVTVSRIGKELGRYPTAVARSIDRMAAKDARYAKVEDAATRTYRFNA